jgi:hypothetical protein
MDDPSRLFVFMSKQEVLTAFRHWVEPVLRDGGFGGRRGHMIRRVGGVTQIIELQHSIYGERFTANLGLDLEWLAPAIRWIPRPAAGPHAHDSIRWIRIGLCGPEKSDHWWSYGVESAGLEAAMRALAESLSISGLQWLDKESAPPSFIEYAREQMERSRSDRHPDGGFVELRLMSAVLAWAGERDQALKFLNRARAIWSEEKDRLEKARTLYKKKHAVPGRLPTVPNLVGELEALISPTTDESPFVARSPSSRRRSLRSSPP